MHFFTDRDMDEYNKKTLKLPKDVGVLPNDERYRISKSAMFVNAPLKWRTNNGNK